MGDRHKVIEKPLRFLKRVCLRDKNLPRGENALLQSAVDQLALGSAEHGLTPDEIDDLVQVICSQVLKESKRKLLIRCLLPSSYVPASAILRCFSWMNTSKATNAIKSLLLRWIVSVLDFLDNLEPVLLLYDAVCFWMYSDALRQHASALLTLVTRKEDVRLYRVKRLLRLKSALGVDAHLNSVLSLYKDYCPHFIPMAIRYSSKGISPRPYLFWMNLVKSIQARNTQVERPMFNTYHNSKAFWDAQNDVNLTKPTVGKKRKLTVLFPEIKDLMAPLSHSDQKCEAEDLIPLRNISSLDLLLDNITRLELPSQAMLVLKYPVLRNVISCYKDFDFLMRLKYRVHWILFDDLIYGALRAEQDTELFLFKLMQFCEYLQEGHPAVEYFLEQYLTFFWNGCDYSKIILSFITRLRMRSVGELVHILDAIKQVFHSSLLSFKFDILHALTKLLSNMVHVEYSRCKKIQRIARASFSSIDTNEDHSSALYLFDDETFDYDPLYTIVHLIEFLDDLYTKSLIMEDGSTLLLHSAFSFYEFTIRLACDYDLPYVICPPPVVIYTALFSCDGVAVARLCGLLVRCSDAMGKLKSMTKHRRVYLDLMESSTARIKLLNTYVVDVINSLWRDKAFAATSVAHDSIFGQLQNATVDLATPKMNTAFSIGKHLGLIGHAMTFSKTVAPSTTEFSFTPHKMNKTQKQSYLEYLKSQGYGNIELLIKTFLK